MHDFEFDSLMERPPSYETGCELLWWADGFIDRLKEGTDLANGVLTQEDVRKVPAAMRRAAECGIDEAWLFLAVWSGEPRFGLKLDGKTALSAFREAVIKRVQRAYLSYARCLVEHASREECVDACNLVEQLVKSDPRNVEASYFLGIMYGLKAAPDDNHGKAIEHFKRAVDLGHLEALSSLAHFYIFCKPPEVTLALAALERAADLGDSSAMFNLGEHYLNGRYVAQDIAKAVAWLEKAVQHHDFHAPRTLAKMYADGKVVPQDKQRAAKLLDDVETFWKRSMDDYRQECGLNPPLAPTF